MRVIRPATLVRDARRREWLVAVSMLAVGGSAAAFAALRLAPAAGSAAMALAAALGLGVGLAWLMRLVRPDPDHRAARELERLLASTFDDLYTLVLLPRLPIAGRGLTGILVGPPGVRALTVRRWEGRYRVRGRIWEFDGHGRGWIRCRTNPSFEAASLAEGVVRWSGEVGLGQVPVTGTVVFPRAFSRIVLEEPEDEVVSVDNVPWWASRIGRLQRIDAGQVARVVEAILQEGERLAEQRAVRRAPEAATSRGERG